MRDYQTKSNAGGLPDTISTTRFGGGEFNSIAVELENAVSTSNQTLAPADGTGEVSDQLAMALAIYGAGGAFYHADTGAVNAYVLAPISPKESPPDYFDGFTVIFEPGTVNTAASTVNIASLGVKSITYSDGSALIGGELSGSCGIKYNSSDDRFELLFSSGGLAGIGAAYVVDATQSDQGAGSSNPDTLTIYDVAAIVGTSKNATIRLIHNPVAGNTTSFNFDTSLDLSNYPNLFFDIDPGARFTRTTGDEVFTIYSPGNLKVGGNQILTTVAMLAFDQGGTVFPEWFGAIGDNATDDSTAFENAAGAAAGGTLHLHGKTYLLSTLSDGIPVASNTDVFIPPGAALNCDQTGTNVYGFKIQDGADNVHIYGGGSIIGPYPAGPGSYEAGQIAIIHDSTSAASNITIENLVITGWAAGAIQIENPSHLMVRNINIRYVGRFGIFVFYGTDVHLYDNRITDIGPGSGGTSPFINAYGISITSDLGYVVTAGTRAFIRGNFVNGPAVWEAYDIHGWNGVIFEGNVAENAMIGLFIGPSTGTNNVDTDNVLVANNTFRTVTTYQRAAILAAPAVTPGTTYADQITIIGNKIYGHGANQDVFDEIGLGEEGAIEVVGIRECLIVGNHIRAANFSSIHLEQYILYCLVSGNLCLDGVLTNTVHGSLKVKDSATVIAHVSANSFVRLNGTGLTAVDIGVGAGSSFGVRYDGSNNIYGSFSNDFASGSIDNMHVNATLPMRIHAKATITNNGTAAVVNSNFNVASASRTGAGVVEVTFTNATTTTDYQVAVTAIGSGLQASITGRTASIVTVETSDASGTPSDEDFTLVVFAEDTAGW